MGCHQPEQHSTIHHIPRNHAAAKAVESGIKQNIV
jgi:hypothetical protein